ncbi:MAG: putative nucleotidyltransferase substrate binding domain-containing protein [Candidatus Binatia bacterium]|nr:putative nucleotidyltransferase substrate binding domain-containing protein [Candidatus Binatia bacterium]
MKAASISYRVADFLRRHPPFEWMGEEELVVLAGTGRVRFHEALEVLHDAGEVRQSQFSVIQQGTVEILDDEGVLHDLLGPGDIVGIGSSERHRYLARTASDVLVYMFPREAVRPLLERHARARRYLETVFSLADEGRAGGPGSLGPSDFWLDALLPEERAQCEAAVCRADESVAAVAGRMTAEGLSAVAVLDGDGRLLGVVRDADFRARVATGNLLPTGEIGALLSPAAAGLAAADHGQPVGAYWRRMLRAGVSTLPLAASPSGDVVGVLTENDLAVDLGGDPLVPILRIGRARSLDQVRVFRRAAETAIERLLTNRRSAPWAVEAAGALDVATCRWVVGRAEADLGAAARAAERCWVLLGAAGRRERFGSMPMGVGLIWRGEPDDTVRMGRLADRVGAQLTELGIQLAFHMLPSGSGIPTHGTLDQWKAAYEGWVHDPIGTGMYKALGFFDVLFVAGEQKLQEQVLAHFRRAVATDETFLPLAANDSMAHMPPLTFFRGQVVDKAGERTELLDLENCAVRPLTDIARVFALQEGSDGDCDTAGRLRAVADGRSENEELFRRSAEAAELALLQRARVAYAHPEDRSEIRPEALLKVERELLKSCFRTILSLLERTAHHFGFPAPR